MIEKLGHGGMGVVYLAEDEEGRRVAVKSLERLDDTGVRELRALRREVQLLSELRHPHVVRVFDADLTGTRPWYAMEYVSGPSLSDVLKADVGSADTVIDTPAPTVVTPADGAEQVPVYGSGVASWDGVTRTALSWIGQIAHALAFIHGEGLIHGDLKPHNIVVHDRRAVLIDFGLADRVGGRITLAGLERAQWSAHTPGYASPESVRSEQLDPRADLYSVGCMIYEIVSGSLPFEGSRMEVILAHANAEPVPLATLVEGVPAPLNALVARLLAKDRNDRPPHALDIIGTLDEIGVSTPAADTLPSVKPYLFPSPVVGRDDEVEKLAGRVLELKSNPGTILILGESGTGKSTLALQAVKAGNTGKSRIIATTGERLSSGERSGEPAVPFSALSGVFDELVDFARAASPREAARVLGPDVMFLASFDARFLEWCDRELPVVKDAAMAAARSLRNILSRLCTLNGMLLVCDELQWFDPASRQALEELVQVAPDNPWLILGLARSDEFELDDESSLARAADVVELGVLDEEDTGRSVAGILGLASVAPEVRRLVYERCAGNPYYIREFMNVALEEGAIVLTETGRWSGAGERTLAEALRDVTEPESVRELTSRRLALLDPDALEAATTAAVIGRYFSVGLLASALPSDETSKIDRALNTLRTRGIIEVTPDPAVLRFTHDRLREALIESLSDGARRAIHESIAEALEDGPGDSAVIAWHYQRAGLMDAATEHWLRAAERARARFDFGAMAGLLAAALESGRAARDEAELAQIAADRAYALCQAEQYDELRREVRALLGRDGVTPVARGKALCALAACQWRTGEVAESLETARAALDHLSEEVDPETYVAALITRADAIEIGGGTDEALAIYHQALAVAEKHGLTTLTLRAYNNVGLTFRRESKYAEALEWFDRGLEHARQARNHWMTGYFLFNLARVFEAQGRYDDALDHFGETLELALVIGSSPLEMRARQGVGVVHLARAEFREARRFLEIAETYYRRTGASGALGYVAYEQARIFIRRGEYERAEEHARRAVKLVEGYPGDELAAWQVLGRIYLQTRQLDRAERAFERALELASELGHSWEESSVRGDLSWVASFRGDGESAHASALQSRKIARTVSSDALLADSLLAEGVALLRMGESAQAVEALESAYDAFRRQQRPWETAVAAAEAATAAHRAGLDSADAWLERAGERLDELDVEATALPHRLFAHARDAAAPGVSS